MSGMGMSMGIHLRPEQRLQQTLSQRMIQCMKILQLPVMAVNELLLAEMQVNPVLELREITPDRALDPEADGRDITDNHEPDPTDPHQELVLDANGDASDDFERLAAMNEEWQNHFNDDQRPSSNRIEEEIDRKNVAEANMAAREQSLQEYLVEQLNYLDAPEEMLRLARHVIAHVANSGYLGRVVKIEKEKKEKERPKKKPENELDRLLQQKEEEDFEEYRFESYTLQDIALSYDRPVTVEQVEEALQLVQKLDPPGVGARDLRECLLLQLTPEMPHYDVLRVLIQSHLEDLEHNRLPIIQKKTGFELMVIQEAIASLSQLNPRPGSRFVNRTNRYVVPDLVVKRNDQGEYEVQLVDDWTPNVYISKRCIELYRNKGSDPKTREFLKKRLQAAQWLMEAIKQRRNTLLKVANAIIRRQRQFLDHGPDHLVPLKMQQIAEQVGVHVTTVSRAVDDKWVQTPRGLFPLKRFFGGGKTVAGEDVAYEVIKQKLLEIIGREDKTNPLSDEELVEKLAAAGYPGIARRTVTKYRKLLKIPSSRQRKVWME